MVGRVSELPVLDAQDQRILGCLLEKQATVPASYPLSANALRAACNQTNNREPVVDFDQQGVEQAARALKDRGLLRIVWSATGRRTLKYHQILDERLGLEPDERALLTVLLLRGPQAPGELRTRTERLCRFETRGDVEECLHRMAERTAPLVRELERRPGQQDARWAHLLGPLPQPAAGVDRGAGIGEDRGARDARVLTSYDAVAAAYARRFVDELAPLPFDTWLLDRVVVHAGSDPVVEVGSGPGHITAYLGERGVEATGVDLSPAMINEARRRFPDRSFEVGDLRQLRSPADGPGWAAVVSWYSLIHLAPSELSGALTALACTLSPKGWLVLAMHAGDAVRHRDEWFGQPVDLDVVSNDPADVVRAVGAAGLVDIEWYLRGPIPPRDETSQNLYVLGRRPH